MQSAADLNIVGDGFFTTNGTAAQPVSIVGEQRLAGFWEGIDIDFSANPLNRLTNTLVADGGGSSGADAANIRMDCNASNFAADHC